MRSGHVWPRPGEPIALVDAGGRLAWASLVAVERRWIVVQVTGIAMRVRADGVGDSLRLATAAEIAAHEAKHRRVNAFVAVWPVPR